MCKPDDIIKHRPKPVKKNIIITIGELDLTITENEIEKRLFSFGNELKLQEEESIELLFFDEETGGRIYKEGTWIVKKYPEVDPKKCAIYKKQQNCCGDLCTTSCKYYAFHLNAEKYNEQCKKEQQQAKEDQSYRQTLDYFFEKKLEVSEQ